MTKSKNKQKILRLTVKQKMKIAKKSEDPVREMGFCPCIPLDQVEMCLGKMEAKRFWKWMSGQTFPTGGVFTWDLERYLKGLPVID